MAASTGALFGRGRLPQSADISRVAAFWRRDVRTLVNGRERIHAYIGTQRGMGLPRTYARTHIRRVSFRMRSGLARLCRETQWRFARRAVVYTPLDNGSFMLASRSICAATRWVMRSKSCREEPSAEQDPKGLPLETPESSGSISEGLSVVASSLAENSLRNPLVWIDLEMTGHALLASHLTLSAKSSCI